MSEAVLPLVEPSQVQPAEVRKIAELAQKVEGAAAFIKAAHPAQVNVFTVHHHGRPSGRGANQTTWYTSLAKSCTVRAQDILAVVEKCPAEGAAIEAEQAAFELLSELTPAPTRLTHLLHADRAKAWRALADQVIVLCSQFEQAAAIVEAVPEESDGTISAAKSFEAASIELLKRAGGSYTLTEATEQLGTSRQALHKRVYLGTALGMMVNGKIQLPKLQFDHPKPGKGNAKILNGIGKVIKPFLNSKAGPWAALEFLLDVDPNLARKPIDALRDGQTEAVVHAAQSHLGMDEG